MPCATTCQVAFFGIAALSGQVYKVPGEEINRNKLRTAEVGCFKPPFAACDVSSYLNILECMSLCDCTCIHSHSKARPTCSIVCAQRPGVDGWVSVIGEVCIWPLVWSPSSSLGKMWHQYTILWYSIYTQAGVANYTGICYIVRAALAAGREWLIRCIYW